MNKAELFRSLSSDQKLEFENDIDSAINKVLGSGKRQVMNVNNIKVHIRLENKIFLHVRMSVDNKGQIQKDQLDIIRFKNVDQFLDSLIDVKKKRN